MRLPLWLLCLLPKTWQEVYIQKLWEDKTDAQILDAYADAVDWITLSNGVFASDTLTSIADECRERLGKYINPQIEKRGLTFSY